MRVDLHEKAKMMVVDYFNENAEITDHVKIFEDQVYIVWFCFILGGWKALVSTTVVDGMYYEVTYNKVGKETYIDAYKKFKNVCIPDEQ